MNILKTVIGQSESFQRQKEMISLAIKWRLLFLFVFPRGLSFVNVFMADSNCEKNKKEQRPEGHSTFHHV